MSELFLKRLELGPLGTNCYLVGGADSRQLVVIDPGGDYELLSRTIENSGRTVEAVLLTHTHFDHVGALADLQEATGVTAFMHEQEELLIRHAAQSAAGWGFELRQPAIPQGRLDHGEELELAGVTLRCLYTPGHSPGHIAFHLADHAVVFSGDALFKGSVGRTDLPLGDGPTLLQSIRNHLLTLPGDTMVFSGHGPWTTIDVERISNPFLT